MDQSSFASKFLSRLQRIDTPQIEAFLTQLVKEKDVQRAILDSLVDGIVLADRELKVGYLNDAARGMLGLGPRKAQGEPVRRIMRAKNLQSIVDDFAGNPRAISHHEVRVKTPEPRIYVVSVIPIGVDDDEPTHSIWLLSDQTEIHRRAAEQQKTESIRSMATLTAGIAHEIKNPLNSITIHAQLMAQTAEKAAASHDDPLMERLQRSSQVVIEEIQRLNRIVDQFIKAVRPTRPDLRTTEINALVESLAELVGPECQERQISLELDLDPAIPSFRVDPEQIYQALLNVVRNAIEAIDKPEGHVVIRTHLRSDHALVEVEDNGCGIPEENRLSIFEPYNTTKFSGTGLGLMVVFRIVSAHGGAIGLDSEVGRGTVFRIALPLEEKPIRLLSGEAVSEELEKVEGLSEA